MYASIARLFILFSEYAGVSGDIDEILISALNI